MYIKIRWPFTFLSFSLLSFLLVLLGIKADSFCARSNNHLLLTPPLRIVVTTSMIGDALEQITQGKATVITLMGPKVDPHSYVPTIQDARRLYEADIIVYSGLHLEGTMQNILEALNKVKPVYAVSDALDEEDIQYDATFSGGVDPHFWCSVPLWKKGISRISDRLQVHDEQNAPNYKKNTIKYEKELLKLHQYILREVQKIPKEKFVVVSHDGLNYLEKTYNLKIEALQDMNAKMDVSLKKRMTIEKLIIENKIKTVYLEPTIRSRPILSLVQNCRIKGYQLDIKLLYSDSLGPKGTAEGTYVGMMKTNITHIVKGLTK